MLLNLIHAIVPDLVIHIILKSSSVSLSIIISVLYFDSLVDMQTIILFTILLFFTSSGLAAPTADLWPVWQSHAEKQTIEIDHMPWQHFLSLYLIKGSDSINRIDYEGVTPKEKAALTLYLDYLQQQTVSKLTRDQQLAFWINLYNAGTVKIILDHYPVETILDVDISPGWFSNGPWGNKFFKVEGRAVSLDDIEHRILRPIWQDPRLHYALNCASLGCPNLQPESFTTENIEILLEKGAMEYINHPRGVVINEGKLLISSIYHWFKQDFGGHDREIIEHLIKYADNELKTKLQAVDRIFDHQYDWTLNDTRD